MPWLPLFFARRSPSESDLARDRELCCGSDRSSFCPSVAILCCVWVVRGCMEVEEVFMKRKLTSVGLNQVSA